MQKLNSSDARLSHAYLLFKLMQLNSQCQTSCLENSSAEMGFIGGLSPPLTVDEFVPIAKFIFNCVKDEKDEKGQLLAKDFGNFLTFQKISLDSLPSVDLDVENLKENPEDHMLSKFESHH